MNPTVFTEFRAAARQSGGWGGCHGIAYTVTAHNAETGKRCTVAIQYGTRAEQKAWIYNGRKWRQEISGEAAVEFEAHIREIKQAARSAMEV